MSDLSLRPIDCGFDPRAHGMACRIPSGTTSVDYSSRTGEDQTVRGSRREIVAALVAAGYTIADTPQDMGRRGGLAGRGASQVRGDSDYYRALRARRLTVLRATIIASGQRRRITVRLERDPGDGSSGPGYNWRGPGGQDCELGLAATLSDARYQAIAAWGAPEWGLQARWLR